MCVEITHFSKRCGSVRKLQFWRVNCADVITKVHIVNTDVYSAKSPKITTESTNMRSERKARISGLAGIEHARNQTLPDVTFPVTE